MKNTRIQAKLIGIPALLILTAGLTMAGLNAAPAKSVGTPAVNTYTSNYQITPFTPRTMQSATCAAACARWVSCISQKAKMSPAQKRQGLNQCMRQCRRNKEKVLACYKKTKNSCASYFTCMVRAAR